MRVLRDEIFRRCVDVRKIASSAARDDDLAANLGIVLYHENSSATFPGLDRTKQPGRSAADDYRIISHSGEIALSENIDMMRYMARHYVDQCPCRNRIVARGSCALRSFV